MPETELDRETIRAAREGDESAFEKIVRFYTPTIYNMALRMCNNREAAQDMSQEIFLRLHSRLSRYDASRPFEPWFFTLAVNVCRNYLTRSRRYEVPLSQISGESDEGFERASTGKTPLEEGAESDLHQLIRNEVKKLPLPYREVIVLRYIKELSYEELAEVLQLPMGTVKNRLFRAREMLKQRLKKLQRE